jgi:hypothetical protein
VSYFGPAMVGLRVMVVEAAMGGEVGVGGQVEVVER